MPPCLNEAKKPGPTCRPIEKTKRINPNSCTKWRTSPSTVMPKWLKRMPTKSIHVTPSETPADLDSSQQDADGDYQRENQHGMGDAAAEKERIEPLHMRPDFDAVWRKVGRKSSIYCRILKTFRSKEIRPAVPPLLRAARGSNRGTFRSGAASSAVASPIRAIARPLRAPSAAPISMARAVPMPCAAAPRANPRASGSRTPQRLQYPLAEDAAEYSHAEDHHRGDGDVAAERSRDRHGDRHGDRLGGDRGEDAGARCRRPWRYRPRSALRRSIRQGWRRPTGSRLPRRRSDLFVEQVAERHDRHAEGEVEHARRLAE